MAKCDLQNASDTYVVNIVLIIIFVVPIDLATSAKAGMGGRGDVTYIA